MKKFCVECANSRISYCEYGRSARCVLDDSTGEDHIHRFKTYGGEKQMKERNKNNDCKDFKRIRFINKIIRALTEW